MKAVRIVSVAQMQWADREAMRAVRSRTLMERAGRAVADAVLEVMPDYGRVVVVAGSGNNGGDGYAAGYFLRRRRIPVTVVALAPEERMTEDARDWRAQAIAAGVKVREALDRTDTLEHWLGRAMIIVDALFGVGLKRPLEGRFAMAVERINASDRPVLAIDIASGIDGDCGVCRGVAVRADWTLPIAACKWGHWLGEGPDHAGQVLPPADIGIPDATIVEAYRACPDGVASAELAGRGHMERAWPQRPRHAHKGDFGHAVIFGGAPGFAGAPRLAAAGALAAGSGLVSIVCPAQVWPVIAAGDPEVMVHAQDGEWRECARRGDAWVAGPGWGRSGDVPLEELLAARTPLVLDADALNRIAEDTALQEQLRARAGWTVITPHPGEAARLLGTQPAAIQADRRGHALQLAKRFACWAVLKGAGTLVASPDGHLIVSPFGGPDLAVGGSGDVLAGMIGMQLGYAQRRGMDDPMPAIAAAVALHGTAGEQRGWHRAGELAGVCANLRQAIERRMLWTLRDDRGRTTDNGGQR